MKNMNKQFGLRFGAMSDPIGSQLQTQGMKFDPKQVKRFQDMIDACLTLQFGFVLPGSENDKIQRRIYKLIMKHVCKENGLREVVSFEK